MEKENKDGQEVHETPAEEEAEETPTNPDEVVVSDEEEDKPLTPEEIADLKKRADVSSQNFERAKKAEEELKKYKAQLEGDDTSDVDEGEVEQLKTKLSEIEGKLSQKEVLETYPVLKEVWSEFEEYTKNEENQGMKLQTAAKAFIAEKELNTPKRKGLEKATGGDKTPKSSGMTSEQLENLRKTDGRKYREMLKKGLIKFKG